jgi:hypothetical protein
MPINEIDIEPLPSGQIGISLELMQIGPTGPTGPANTLTIGSVTSGATPSATITGAAPSQTLNLVLAKGDTGIQGNQGLKGDTGDAGQDALWNYTGTYSGGTSYAVGDLAIFNGQLFYRKNSNGGNVGDTPSESSQFWDLLAAKGEQGETGLQGDEGPAGADALWNFRGEFVESEHEEYNIGDIVTYNGSLWYCLEYISGSMGYFPDAYQDFMWQLIAAKGDTGAAGAAGATGPQGDTGDTGPQGPAGPEPSLNIADNANTAITLADTDNNQVVRCTSSSAVTITVPSTLAAGFSCMVIQAGTGRVTFVADSGATLNSFGNLLATAGQHAPASLMRVGAGIYNLSGNLV